MNWEEFLKNNYKRAFIVPILLVVFSLIIVGSFYFKTGDFFDRDVSLKGGVSATIYERGIDSINLKESLEKELLTDVFARNIRDVATNEDIGVVVEIGENRGDELKSGIENQLGIALSEENFSIEEVGSSLGESFYQDLIKAVLIAFLLMGAVVFITFRSFVPSAAVLLSAFIDILVPLAVINLLGIKVSTAGIAAFLLVIGYSVDTDILLAVKVLKRKDGDVYEKIVDAAKTGLTMTVTTVVALSIAYFVTSSFVLKQMFLIIILALLTDVITTYFMNSGIFIWYSKRRGEDEKFWG